MIRGFDTNTSASEGRTTATSGETASGEDILPSCITRLNFGLMCTTSGCNVVLLWALLLMRFCAASPPTSTSTSTSTKATAAEEDEGSKISLWDTINRNPSYTNLTACLQAADPSIATALRDSQQHPLTLFAPTDAAFDEPGWECAAGTVFECKYVGSNIQILVCTWKSEGRPPSEVFVPYRMVLVCTLRV